MTTGIAASVHMAEVMDRLLDAATSGVGHAAASLNRLIGEPIELIIPSIRFAAFNDAATVGVIGSTEFSTVVRQRFSGKVSGQAALAFPRTSGLTLAALLSGIEKVDSELDVELGGVLLEIGNILLNGVLAALSGEAFGPLRYSLPMLHNGSHSCAQLFCGESDADQDSLIADIHFCIHQREICSLLMIVFDRGAVSQLMERESEAVGT